MKTTKFDAQAFQFYFQHVTSEYKQKQIVVILYNACIHHAKLFQPFLKKYKETLILLFLPLYSPSIIWGSNVFKDE